MPDINKIVSSDTENIKSLHSETEFNLEQKINEILSKIELQRRKTKITNILLIGILVTNVIIYTYGGILFFGVFKDFIDAFF